ncbi:hypothetical protein ACRALDRAFT_2111752, partial [Sodiomyces alcalophilus JCM 7366]|uniref:uncharacterized protein n=1 Tax=Sodiomyces alcalophilus JCM 7366 TaxID=591952 RepID=UPI0039B48811
RLIFNKKDTILIATTRYGKSIILYVYIAIIAKITIIIVPLSRLAETYLKVYTISILFSFYIATNLILIDNVCEGKYSYIILSPKQLISPGFKAIAYNPVFGQKLGLLAINKVYIIS